MSSSCSSNNGSMEFSQVSDSLVYKMPDKEDFPKSTTNWKDGLNNILAAVEKSDKEGKSSPIVLFKNDRYVCTYDMYPKAKYHLLLMSRKKNAGKLCHVDTLNDLKPKDVQYIKEFHTLAKNIASSILLSANESSSTSFKFGYHVLPSFEPLHLHIISSDLQSSCITNRKHVVSFTSPLFFVDSTALEKHLESAFADKLVLSVRQERAASVRDSTPMFCPRCKRVASSVPDWKTHNEQCNIIEPMEYDESKGALNSLLGWRRKVCTDEADEEEDETENVNPTVSGVKRAHPSETRVADIEPPIPTRFMISADPQHYFIYMAIREKGDSLFARGLEKTKAICPDEMVHCLQHDRTRHVTMFSGQLTASEVRNLKFRGQLAPVSISFAGWQPWISCCLMLTHESQNELRYLLSKIEGLPRFKNNDDQGMCDHISLYRKRSNTTLPFPELKEGFDDIKRAWSRDFGTVEGVSIRISSHGTKGNYEQCKILAEVQNGISPSPKKQRPSAPPNIQSAANDISIASKLQLEEIGEKPQPIDLLLPWEEKSSIGKEKLVAAVIPDLLSTKECKAIIEVCEESGFDQALLNVGGGREVLSTNFRKSLRCIIDDTEAAKIIFIRLKHVIPQTLTKNGQSWQCVELNERLRVLKYEVSDYFKPHTDGSYQRQNGDTSMLTLMLYLNSPIAGGDTNFLSSSDGQHQKRTVNPTTGQGLLFDHTLRHESTVMEAGVKYAIRTDVMYRRVNNLSTEVFSKKRKQTGNYSDYETDEGY